MEPLGRHLGLRGPACSADPIGDATSSFLPTTSGQCKHVWQNCITKPWARIGLVVRSPGPESTFSPGLLLRPHAGSKWEERFGEHVLGGSRTERHQQPIYVSIRGCCMTRCKHVCRQLKCLRKDGETPESSTPQAVED